MEAFRDLAPETWGRYLDEMSVELFNAEVSIEIVEGGRRHAQAERLALQTLAYDRHDDVFEVAAARGTGHLPSVLRHMIDHPVRIAVDSPNRMAPTTITVDDPTGTRAVVRVSRPADFSG